MKQVAAALIFDSGGKLLICQRTRHQPMPLKWEFPGGKKEDGELLEHALVRELEEELGILASVGRKISSIRHQYRNGNAVELHFFAVSAYQGEVNNHIFEQIRWVKLSELPQYEFLEADRELVEGLAAGRTTVIATEGN